MRKAWKGKEKVSLTIFLMPHPILLSSLQGPPGEEVAVEAPAS